MLTLNNRLVPDVSGDKHHRCCETVHANRCKPANESFSGKGSWSVCLQVL
jgi:hypothetical protein